MRVETAWGWSLMLLTLRFPSSYLYTWVSCHFECCKKLQDKILSLFFHDEHSAVSWTNRVKAGSIKAPFLDTAETWTSLFHGFQPVCNLLKKSCGRSCSPAVDAAVNSGNWGVCGSLRLTSCEEWFKNTENQTGFIMFCALKRCFEAIWVH